MKMHSLFCMVCLKYRILQYIQYQESNLGPFAEHIVILQQGYINQIGVKEREYIK